MENLSMKRTLPIGIAVSSVILLLFSVAICRAFESEESPGSKGKKAGDEAPTNSKGAGTPVAMNKSNTVYLDKKGNRVLVKAKVVLREGLLEMLCCPAQTKEHESVLAVNGKAYVIHGSLVALGAEPGAPVQFTPAFKPPTGTKIDIYLNWTDDKGKLHRDKAQSWVRHAVRRYYVAKLAKLPAGLTLPKKGELSYDEKHQELLWYGHMTKKQREANLALSNDAEFKKAINSFFEQSQPREMEADFVFAGSQFYKDEQTGEEFYAAEGGDLICVANFPSAMIDVAMESSSSGMESLVFEPYTERIPPMDTEVTIELIPVLKKDKAPGTPSGKAKSNAKAETK
jgi:hypothetical protein